MSSGIYADVLSSLQLMQDYGVNLICVEDGIDSSKEAGKLLISIIAAVAEMERENIRVQTMAGREQKAREGKWNGGFAPYGYKLENGELVIAEDEVEIIQMIFDRYIHTNDGINGVANYLNNHCYTKKLRQNGTIPGFSSGFIKKIIDNPVYMRKSMKLLFLKRTGILHRRNVLKIIIEEKRFIIRNMQIFCHEY